MGTNYYLVSKEDYEIHYVVDKMLNVLDNDKINKELRKILENNYSSVINLLRENHKDDLISHIYNQFDEILNNIEMNLTYDLKFNLSLIECNSKHIGKSSWGWLFNFQEQDEWHSYEEFKSFILDKDNRDKYAIIDEESRYMEPEELLELIDNKQSNPRNLENPDNFRYCKNVNGYRFSQGDFS